MKGSHLKKPWLTTFQEAKQIVKEFNIKTYQEYLDWKERPRELPVNPRVTYKNEGWVGTRDFFGTSRPSIQQLKEILINNNITSHTDYINWDKKKKYHLPANLGFAFKDEGFNGIPELLGNEGPRSYDEQRAWIKKHQDIKSSHEFVLWLQKGSKPSFISARPDRKFGKANTNEWVSWETFLVQ